MTTEWTTKTKYVVGDEVRVYSYTYVCVRDHESNVFANDLFDKHHWKRLTS